MTLVNLVRHRGILSTILTAGDTDCEGALQDAAEKRLVLQHLHAGINVRPLSRHLACHQDVDAWSPCFQLYEYFRHFSQLWQDDPTHTTPT